MTTTTRLREEFDGDLQPQAGISELPSDTHTHAVPCSTCARTFYADDDMSETLQRSFEKSNENTSVCPRCELEQEEMSRPR
jgi:hypothetical protein